jgi:hypothetical protein
MSVHTTTTRESGPGAQDTTHGSHRYARPNVHPPSSAVSQRRSGRPLLRAAAQFRASFLPPSANYRRQFSSLFAIPEYVAPPARLA